MMQDRTFRGQSADGVWHEGFLIRSPGVKNSRPGEGWYINSEQEPAYAHLVKPFTIGMSTGVKDMEGTMVFEGDIIKTTGSNERIFSVEFGEYIAYGVSHIGFYAKIAGKNSRDYNPCCLRGNCFSPFHFFCSSPASFIRYGVSLMFPTTFPM